MSKIYEYDENSSIGLDENLPIRITEGKYAGVVYRYGKINFSEDGEHVRCNFNYDILENPNSITEDQEFINFLGEIVVEMLDEEIHELGDDFLRSGDLEEEREAEEEREVD